jgi:hypothetical protein
MIEKEECCSLRDMVAIVVQENSEQYFHVAEKINKQLFSLTGKARPVVYGDHADDGAIILRVVSSASVSESYRLTIGPRRIIIDGDGHAALFWGIQTLAQIMHLHGEQLPCLEIADSPDFPHRGFYHDVTRGKVPTLATLKLLVDKLAFYKINQLQLYIEHSFAFKNIPELWRDKDPLTAEEIVDLDAYCRKKFIDLVPSIATFGHLYELLRIKRFEHLNELDIAALQVPHNLWDRMAHYTIDIGQEESYRLIRSMIEEFAPLFSSRYFNICCDETFDLGKGKNRDRAAAVGVGRIYVDFVKKIVAAVHACGKTPMMWGDIVLHHPALIAEIPGDTVFLNWNYGAEATEDAAKAFADARVQQYVCPGVQGWSRFANEINVASANIRKMAAHGKRYGAAGVLTTDWGDCGHVNFLANSFHGMALGAALSWNESSYPDNESFDAALSAMEWGDRTRSIAKLLRELGSLCFYHFGNMYAWINGVKGTWDKECEVEALDCEALAERYNRASEIAGLLADAAADGRSTGSRQDFDEFIWSAGAIRWTLALLAFKKKNEYGQQGCPALYGNKERLLADGAALVTTFERLWRNRNKESELRNVTETFGKVFARIKML